MKIFLDGRKEIVLCSNYQGKEETVSQLEHTVIPLWGWPRIPVHSESSEGYRNCATGTAGNNLTGRRNLLYSVLHFPYGLARIYTSIFAMNGEENK